VREKKGVAGPTVFLLQTLVQNTGMYISSLFEITFNLYAYDPTDWIGGWTLFYWGWWIAWAPFLGMFIARVSKGRSIREFVVGVLLVPVGFTFMWMTFFGDTALHMIMIQGIGALAEAVVEGLVAAALLLAGGLAALQTATIASALPFTLVMILMCWGLLRALRIEGVKRVSLREARVMPRGPHAALNWRQRLRVLVGAAQAL